MLKRFVPVRKCIFHFKLNGFFQGFAALWVEQTEQFYAFSLWKKRKYSS